MNTVIALVLLAAALFAMAYISKRRFGVLGLALCAGSLLSASWAMSLTPFLEGQGVALISPPLSAVVAAGLILLPPVLLLFGGPTYAGGLGRLGGAAVFAVLAFVFLLDAISAALVFDEISRPVYDVLYELRSVIIVIGIALALFDIVLTRSPKRGKSKSEH